MDIFEIKILKLYYYFIYFDIEEEEEKKHIHFYVFLNILLTNNLLTRTTMTPTMNAFNYFAFF